MDTKEITDAIGTLKTEVSGLIKDELGKQMTANKSFRYVEGTEENEAPPAKLWKGIGQFAQDVYRYQNGRGNLSDALGTYIKKDMTIGVPVDGGVLAPDEYRAELLQVLLGETVLVQYCKQIPMARHTLTIPKFDVTSLETTTFGGIAPANVLESGTKRESQPSFETIQMTIKRKAATFNMTEELREDSAFPALQTLITDAFSSTLRFRVEGEVFHGAGGAAEAEGILNSGALVVQDIEAGQTDRTIVPANIYNMYGRMWPEYLNEARWYCSPDTFGALYSNGVIGGQSVFVPAGNSNVTPTLSLLGRPLTVTQHCPPLGQQGCIIFVAPSQYLFGVKTSGLSILENPYLYFLTDTVAIRAVLPYEGLCAWTAPLTPANGGPDLSPFVALAMNAGST